MKRKTTGLFLLFFIVVVSCANAQSPIKITLLGTGAPVPSIERFGPSILVEAGGQKLLFDCGRGAGQRLWQLKIPLGQIDALFLTHLHSDHVVGIPDVWLTGWIPAVFGRRAYPVPGIWTWRHKGYDGKSCKSIFLGYKHSKQRKK